MDDNGQAFCNMGYLEWTPHTAEAVDSWVIPSTQRNGSVWRLAQARGVKGAL